MENDRKNSKKDGKTVEKRNINEKVKKRELKLNIL